ncbi:MAG: hypothetical protein Q7R30_10170 [Acidobacteriota bacterium]|nr:hypothetical protein [Acidobacteriota bacterium]
MEWSTEHDSVTGEEYIAVDMRGEAVLREPFTLAEREEPVPANSIPEGRP